MFCTVLWEYLKHFIKFEILLFKVLKIFKLCIWQDQVTFKLSTYFEVRFCWYTPPPLLPIPHVACILHHRRLRANLKMILWQKDVFCGLQTYRKCVLCMVSNQCQEVEHQVKKLPKIFWPKLLFKLTKSPLHNFKT
jgi:hypothetical protein